MLHLSFITAKRISASCQWLAGLSRCIIHTAEFNNNKFLEGELLPERFNAPPKSKSEQLQLRREKQQKALENQSVHSS